MLPPEQKELFAPYFEEVTAQENGPLFFPVLRACQELGISIPTEEKIQIITVPSEILTASEADPAVGEVFVYFNYQNEQLRRQYDSEISLYLGVVRQKPGNDICCDCCQIGVLKNGSLIPNKKLIPDITVFYLEPHKQNFLKLNSFVNDPSPVTNHLINNWQNC